MKPEIKSMTPYEWLLLTILSVVWGGSFFFVGVAVDALPPLTIVALRVSLATFVLLVVIYFSGLRMPTSPKVWIAFIFMGFLNNALPFTLIVWGQTHIASGLASILNATTPLFTIVAAHLLLVTLLIPVSAILLGTAILGEQLELKHMMGMGLISVGLLSMDGRAFPAILNRFTKRQTTHQH